MALCFRESEWAEFSDLVYLATTAIAEEAVKEAVIPLLAENEVLKGQARAARLYKWGFWGVVGVAVVTTAIAVLK